MEVKFYPKNKNIHSQCTSHNCQPTPIKLKLKDELKMKQKLEKCNQMENENSNILMFKNLKNIGTKPGWVQFNLWFLAK
jgi:hypothetical protein